ncbi:hypothetical protein D3C84_904290 [compost metagenome]
MGDEVGAGAGRKTKGGERRAAVVGEGHQFGGLVAFEVDHLQPVPCVQGHDGQPGGRDAVAFQVRGSGEQGRLQRPGYHGQIHAVGSTQGKPSAAGRTGRVGWCQPTRAFPGGLKPTLGFGLGLGSRQLAVFN